MEIVILSMVVFAFISAFFIFIDSLRIRKKMNEIISKHNLLAKALACDLQTIEKEIENLKNQMK